MAGRGAALRGAGVGDRPHAPGGRRVLLDIVATILAIGIERYGFVGQHGELVVLTHELVRQVLVGGAIHRDPVHDGALGARRVGTVEPNMLAVVAHARPGHIANEIVGPHDVPVGVGDVRRHPARGFGEVLSREQETTVERRNDALVHDHDVGHPVRQPCGGEHVVRARARGAIAIGHDAVVVG